jgi:pimeloyl-ACP methyl ester carboxylesterase
MATFVLVHGAWHGGWCWRRVAEPLRKMGHAVFTPTLTGVGERAHLLNPSVDLITHVRDVVGVIEVEELDKVVLVGHSYAGMVITGVADTLTSRIDAMVYLDAFMPQPGQSMIDLLPANRRQAVLGHTEWMTPAPNAAYFKVATQEDQDWVDRRTTPHPAITMRQPLQHSRPWEKVRKRVYIPAEIYNSPVFMPTAAKLREDPKWNVIGIPCGHDVMVDAPERLVEVLVDASR